MNRGHHPQLGLLVALGLAAAAGSFWDDPGVYAVGVAVNAGIAVIAAVSLNLIHGHAGQFSLGHAGFMAVGAYASAALTSVYGPRWLGAVPESGIAGAAFFLVALLGGGLLASLCGLLVGIPSLRLRGDYLGLVTLGFGEIIRVVCRNIDDLGGAQGLYGIFPYTHVGWVYGWAAVTVFTVGSLVGSTYGRGFPATRENEVAAEAMGLSTTRYKVTAFVVGAFFAGIGGGLFAHYNLTITPTGFDFGRSVELVVMVILGGMGRTLGVLLAAVLLTLLPEGLRLLPIENIQYWRMVIYALLLIGMMLVRPQGLLGGSTSARRA